MKAGAVPGGWHWWDTAPTQTPSPSFSRDTPRATSAIAAQGPAAVPRSSWQHRGAGSGQDTTKGQRGAFWEAAERGHRSKPPTYVSHVPAPTATFPRGFGMKLLPLDRYGQKRRQGPHLPVQRPSLYRPFSAWREGQRSGLASPSLGATRAFPLIFLPAWPQPSETKEGEANWLRGIEGGGVQVDGVQHQPQRPL